MSATPPKPTTMIFSPQRIVLCIAIVAAVGVYAVLLPGQRSAMPPVADAPWIGLPETGMDASKAELRMLLRRETWPSGYGDPMANLSHGCGTGQAGIRERYIAHVSKNAWGPFWDIQFDVDGDWMNVSIRDGMPAPAPEPVDANGPVPEGSHVYPVSRVRLKKSDLEPIRRIWSEKALWHAEQKPLGCLDGMPVTLEACVDGRYAVRHRNCDVDAYGPTGQLWQAINRILPAPEPAYWRER